MASPDRTALVAQIGSLSDGVIRPLGDRRCVMGDLRSSKSVNGFIFSPGPTDNRYGGNVRGLVNGGRARLPPFRLRTLAPLCLRTLPLSRHSSLLTRYCFLGDLRTPRFDSSVRRPLPIAEAGKGAPRGRCRVAVLGWNWISSSRSSFLPITKWGSACRPVDCGAHSCRPSAFGFCRFLVTHHLSPLTLHCSIEG